MSEPYRVVVADNFHYQDEDDYSSGGEYATADEAVARCMQIVDEYLARNARPGMSADDLYANYVSFGDDPFVRSTHERVEFSARTYAKKRAHALCGGSSGTE